MAGTMRSIASIAACSLLLHTAAFGQMPKPQVPELLKVMPRALESLPFPAGTVVVVSDSKDAFKSVDAVVLSPEEYKKLLESIEQLRAQLAPERAEIPSICRLEIRPREDGAGVRATYEFRTSKPRTTISLGFRQSNAVAARLDKAILPALQTGVDGYSAIIEEPGTHTLALDFEAPMQTRAATRNERRIALTLPGSAITLIEALSVPAGVGGLRVRPVWPVEKIGAGAREFNLSMLKNVSALQPIALGPIDGVELSWDAPATAKPQQPLMSVDGQVQVRISDTSVESNARLTIRSQRGPVTDWPIHTPAGATVLLTGEIRAEGVTVTPTNAERSSWLVKTPPPGLDEITVDVQTQSARSAGTANIGPFYVPSAIPQRGAMSIFAPDHLRARYSKLRADVRPADLPNDDPNGPDAVFTFGNSTLPANLSSSPLLSIDAEVLRGEVRTQATHQLSLEPRGWRLVTQIRANPLRTQFNRLEIELPPEIQDVQSPTDAVVEIVPSTGGAANRWLIRLDRARRNEVTIQIEGWYSTPAKGSAIQLRLPRLVQTVDRAGRVQVAVPPNMEMIGTVQEWDRDRVSDWSRLLEQSTSQGKQPVLSDISIRSPAVVALTWSPTRFELPIRSTIDVTLGERTAQIRQQLSVPPGTTAQKIILQPTPGSELIALRAIQGGMLSTKGDQWVLTVAPNESNVVFTYSCSIRPSEDPSDSISLGVFWPGQATSCETRIRFWSATSKSATRPVLAEGPWEAMPIERVPDRASLPVLVLQGAGTMLPLKLQLESATGLTGAGTIIEKVLVQAAAAGGQHDYRVRFLIRSVAEPQIELELPLPPAALNLDVRTNGGQLKQVHIRDEAGRSSPANLGKFVSIPLEQRDRPQVLEIRYQLAAERRFANWEYVFTPPRLRGSVFVGAVRWQIGLPGDDVVFITTAGDHLEQRWQWGRFLFAPVPSRTGPDLEHWFRQSLDRTEAGEPEAWDARAVVAPTNLDQVRLVPMPRPVWLLASSLVVLVFGLSLLFVRRISWLFWTGATITAAALGVTALLWPQATMTGMAGSLPGWLVLTVAIFLQWLVQRRYERRVVFMPGFSRRPAPTPMSAGSSIRRRETSTVDAPPTR